VADAAAAAPKGVSTKRCRNQEGRIGQQSAELLHDPGLIYLTAALNKDQSLDEVRKTLIQTIEAVAKPIPPPGKRWSASGPAFYAPWRTTSPTRQSIATGALNNAIAQGDWRLMFCSTTA